MKVPEDRLSNTGAQRVLELLIQAGHQAYFVGGTVRNALMARPVSDFDIATSALPAAVLSLADAAGIRSVPTGIDHGTVTLIVDKTPYEVTTFRRDVATDGRRAVVAFATDLTDDARRRDFTMNALYADQNGDVIDPLGGLPDLRAGRVRFIDDPQARIREDYLRILRFFRFTAWYGDPALGIDPEGLAACAALADGMAQLSAERVGAEMVKLLVAQDPAPAVAAMAASGVLARVLPGCDATGLAPLIHAEGQLGLSPDALRRLAVLGGEAGGLRLSRAQVRRLERLRDGVGSGATPLALGHALGVAEALDVLVLRQALLGSAVAQGDRADVAKGAAAVFPVRASDLPDHLRGAEIGTALAELKRTWLASGCQLSREVLLSRL